MQLNNDVSKIKWDQFLKGDKEAYSWIYTTYIQSLYTYGLHFTTDSELIKDCIQEVFTRIYKNRATLLSPDNIKLYLFISLKNTLFNSLDKIQLYTNNTDMENMSFFISNTVEDEFLQNEAKNIQEQELERIFSVLTIRQHQIMYYRFVEELSFDQICEIMDMNYQSAHNLIQRSLKKIRENYDSVLFFVFLLKYCI